MSAAVSISRYSGGLPEWAVVSERRHDHIARVVALVEEWALALELPPGERERWAAAAWLHDALRDAPHPELREQVPPECRDWPGVLLHGPAAAVRVRAEGLDDSEVLEAIAYHTLGHSRLGRVGHALYLADFLEPGRHFRPAWRAALRARLPQAMDEVLRDVTASRIAHLVGEHATIRQETLGFWNALVRREA